MEKTFRHRFGDWFNEHPALIPLIIYLFLATLYLLFPTRNYYWDGITFAQAIEGARNLASLVHPSHLIYNWLGFFFYKLLHAVGFNVRALTALQILNGILSAFAGVVVFFILKSTTRSLYLSTFLTLLFAFSATWWQFSSDADAYVVSVLFLLVAFYLLLPGKPSRPLLTAVVFSLSMLFHELAIFFGPVAVLGFLLKRDGRETKPRLFSIARFGLLSFVLTVGTYLYCFYMATHRLDLSFFLRWITYYSPDASFTFNIWDDLGYTLRGHTRLFLKGRFNLLAGLMNPLVVVLLVVLLLDFCLLCYVTVKTFSGPGLKTVRSLLNNLEGRPLLLLSASWFGIYVIFLFFWLPQNTFYRLFYLPSIIMLVGLFAWARYNYESYKPTYRLALLTIAVALANFLFLIFPYSHKEKFPPTRFAFEMGQEWPPGTLIYYNLENSDKNLIRYFAPSTVWLQLKDTSVEDQLSESLADGKQVWLETTAIDRLSSTPEGKQWLTSHGVQSSRREVKDKGFRIEFVRVGP